MTDQCSIDGCDRERYCRGMCTKHYQASKKDWKPPCSIAGCDTAQYARGWCRRHYDKWLKYGDPHEDRRQVKGSCSIEGCERENKARGLCFLHYDRWRAYGDPLATSGRLAPPEVRFWRKVHITPGCWLWQGKPDKGGYGVLNVTDGKRMLAHRFSYELHAGPIPEGLHIDHLCKVTMCVNPAHLEAVTPYENWRRSDSPATIASRKTHCKRGHPLSGDNLRLVRSSRDPERMWRQCKECKRVELRKQYWRRKEARKQ